MPRDGRFVALAGRGLIWCGETSLSADNLGGSCGEPERTPSTGMVRPATNSRSGADGAPVEEGCSPDWERFEPPAGQMIGRIYRLRRALAA